MGATLAGSSLSWLDDSLAELDELHLRRHLGIRGSSQSSTIRWNDRQLTNFGSNDYLGLANDARLALAATQAVESTGWGSGASPLVTGRSELHAKLEHELASFEGTEATLLFSTGYAANLCTISALVGKGDIVFSDARNHASIIDGCRLSGAQVQIYPHVDVLRLWRQLKSAQSYRRRLIVTDSLFSMDGNLAPLNDLAELAANSDSMLMVDEAHATGVFGTTGRGVSEHFGVEDVVDVRVGTLSKALGSFGGFVAGTQNLIDWLTNRARGYVFSTAMPEATCAASLAALNVVREEPQRRIALLDRADDVRRRLIAGGCNVANSTSQIIPVIIGDADVTMQIAADLRERGLFVPGIRPPSVPAGESLLRISLSYEHDDDAVNRLVDEVTARVAEAKALGSSR